MTIPVVLAVGFVLYLLFNTNEQRQQYGPQPHYPQPNRICPPNPPVLKPTQIRRRRQTIIQSWDCSICLMESTDDVITLSCTHVFHKDCIQQWLCIKGTCPLCRENARINTI